MSSRPWTDELRRGGGNSDWEQATRGDVGWRCGVFQMDTCPRHPPGRITIALTIPEPGGRA